MNQLKISHNVKIDNDVNEIRDFIIFIDGEKLLIANPNFPRMTWKEKSKIVTDYIREHRIRYKTKDVFDIKWEEVNSQGKSLVF